MMKKVVALLCAAVMVVSMAACGSKPAAEAPAETPAEEVVAEAPAEEKEPVTITYWYENGVGEQQCTQDVEDKLNEILASTEGYEYITIDLVPSKDSATDIALAQTTGEQIDLISTFVLNMPTEIANGAIMPLNDLLAANPEVTADLPDWFVDYGKVDGEMYFIPNYQQCANQFYFITPTELLENSGYTEEQVREILLAKDVDKLEEFYTNYIEAARVYKNSDTMYMKADEINNIRYWVQPSNSIFSPDWFAVFYWDEENEKINFTDLNENVQAGYLANGRMYENGILYKDSYTDTEFGKNANMASDFSMCFNTVQSYGTDEMVSEQYTASLGFDVTAINTHDYVFLSNTNAAGGVAVSSTCEHPEEAVKVLALLFNAKYEEFYNTLCWGIEGVHYNKLEEGKIETLEFTGAQGGAETTYCYHKWRGGNTFNAWLNQSITQEQEDYILNEINEGDDTVVTPLMGFVLDTKPVANEIAQITAVVTEYQQALRLGAKGAETESYLAEYLDKLEKAGLSKILDEFNTQADAFLGK